MHFKPPRVLTVNRIPYRTFRDKNNNDKADSLLPLNFNVYIDVDNRERARAKAKGKKTSRPISLEEKHNNFINNDGKKKGKSQWPPKRK